MYMLKQILSVAALNNLQLVFPVSEFQVSNKPKEFLIKFPYGTTQIPAFEHSEGWMLLEGGPIVRYRKQASRVAA